MAVCQSIFKICFSFSLCTLFSICLIVQAALHWGCQSTERPREVVECPLWRHSKPTWMHSCVTSSGWPCHGSGMGLDDLQRSFLTLTLLWFCDFSTALWLLHHSSDVQGLLHVIVSHSLCNLWVRELQSTQLASGNFSACCPILRCALGAAAVPLNLRFLLPEQDWAKGFEQLEAWEGW